MSDLCLDCDRPIEQPRRGRRRKYCVECRPPAERIPRHKPTPRPRVTECAQCGAPSKRMYCSQQCRDASRRVPCAGCQKPIYHSTTSLPVGRACCRDCRRLRLAIRDCAGCGASFTIRPRNPKCYCSRACANTTTAATRPPREGQGPRRSGRACEVCGAEYKANHAGQRTCGRTCGAIIQFGRSPGKTGKTCRIYFPECDQCGQVFTARSSRSKRCSAQCRIDASGHRVKDLYALITEHRGQGPAAGWRKNLVDLLRRRDGDHCGICLLTIDFTLTSGPKGDDGGASIDHIQPRSLGGGDELPNLRLTHWGCNRRRSNRVDEDALFAA